METISLTQLLTIFAWFFLALLLAFFMLIGRFYQKLTQEQTYYQWFAVPILLFGAAAAHYAGLNRAMGDVFGDVMLALGGGILIVLCVHLYRLMTTGR